MEQNKLKNIIEAALMAVDEPISVERIQSMFDANFEEVPNRAMVKDVVTLLQNDYQDRGIEIKEVASGYRVQVATPYAEWINRLWEDRPPKYSRALLETLAIIAYRQPVTRGEIEDIRGVSVSTNIIKVLLEREWVRVAGHRDVPGRPSVYVTTRQFLDYFNMKGLSEMPELPELRDLDEIAPDLFATQTGQIEGQESPLRVVDGEQAGPAADDSAETEAAEQSEDVAEAMTADDVVDDEDTDAVLLDADNGASEQDEEETDEGTSPDHAIGDERANMDQAVASDDEQVVDEDPDAEEDNRPSSDMQGTA